MNLKRVCIVSAFFSILLLPQASFAFGSLAEFLSPSGNTIRTSVAFSSDIIAEPRWSSAANVQLELCTFGTYSSAPITFHTTQITELTNDIGYAVNAWTAVAGGPSFTFPIRTDCTQASGSGNAQNASNRVTFVDNLSPGILAVTTLHETASAGVLTINEADIEFNINFVTSDVDDKFATRACHTCVGDGCPAGCPPSGAGKAVSFAGVLIHELGHFLGLSHSLITDDKSSDDGSAVSSVATMFPSISSLLQSVTIEDLAFDDILSKKNLYLPSGFPNLTTEGSISGTVRIARDQVLFRGAHIYAYDTTTRKSIAGTFSGMGGTLISSTGTYSIKGIPFDTPFIVVAEPAHRPESPIGFSYGSTNAPIAISLENQITGISDFAVEAYPDVNIVDIRSARSSTTTPGISDAQVLTLTASQPSLADIDFNVSDNLEAPNDAETLSIAFNSNTAISNSNPLQISLTALGDLAQMPTHAVSLSAVKAGTVSDWTAGIPTVTWSGTSIVLDINPQAFRPSNGVYSLTFAVIDSRFGTFTANAEISVSNWTESASVSGDSGGGGCGLSSRSNSKGISSGLPVAFAFLALSFGILRIISRRRPTSLLPSQSLDRA